VTRASRAAARVLRGALVPALVLGLGGVAARAAAEPSALAERFDRIAVPVADTTPLAIAAFADGAWRTSPVDVFPGTGDAPATAYLRARDLGEPGQPAPSAARVRVRALRDGDDAGAAREGFLVPASPQRRRRVARMDANVYHGPLFSLAFPDLSGFYRELRVGADAPPLVRAIRLDLVAELPAGFGVERTDADFRWTLERVDAGSRFVRRSSTAAARSLWRYTDPRPQTAFFGADTIEQQVTVDLPRALLAVARAVRLENGFEVARDTRVLLPDDGTGRVLLPGESAWRPLDALPGDAPYTAIALANDGGVLVHRLVREGAARDVTPTLWTEPRGGDASVVGYRVEHVERAVARGGDGATGFVLGQDVAVLGGGAYARALTADAERTRALAAELAEASRARPWRVTHETLR